MISEAYRLEQRRLHAQPQGYGGRGAKWADTVHWLAAFYQAAELLDYGCGQGSLAAELARRGLVCREYDPAIDGKDAAPAPADLVICTDVLEHIEPEHLDAVLADLRRLTRRGLFLIVNTQPANKWLSDGRNAHLIQEPGTWWEARLAAAGLPQSREALEAVPLPPRLLTADKAAKYWLGIVTVAR